MSLPREAADVDRSFIAGPDGKFPDFEHTCASMVSDSLMFNAKAVVFEKSSSIASV